MPTPVQRKSSKCRDGREAHDAFGHGREDETAAQQVNFEPFPGTGPPSSRSMHRGQLKRIYPLTTGSSHSSRGANRGRTNTKL